MDATSETTRLQEAPLSVIDWAKLKTDDAEERLRLLAACEEQGFFYLDLQGEEGFSRDWEAVLGIMDGYFAKSVAEKMKDDRKSDTHGYEPVATSTGAVNALPDYYESLKASRGELTANTAALPPTMQQNHALFLRFTTLAHDACIAILNHLDRCLPALATPQARATTLAGLHPPDKDSLTTLALFRYPKQDTAQMGAGHNKHTDLGTLTFLLCQQWGLQVLSKHPPGWHFVAPKPGHAVINVGDTLRFVSGNRLRSAVHRVVPPRGDLQHEDRYSIAYFLRADNEGQFVDSTGRVISAKMWHDEKFDVFRQTHEEQERNVILTGGMEREGAIVV